MAEEAKKPNGAEQKEDPKPNPNLAIWDAVFGTDPAHTKSFTRAGGFSGTAIKPLYLIHKATALWGPMGDAWGAKELDRVIHGETIFMKAMVWYPGPRNKMAQIEHWGGDVLMKKDKPNDEAFKMAFTDAIGKCLVQLGFSADVHLGMFDDSKYVDERQKIESATPGTAKEIYGTHAAMKRKFAEIVQEMNLCPDYDSLAATWKENNSHILAMKKIDEAIYDELVKLKDARKKSIADEMAIKASYSQAFNEAR